MRLFSIVGVLLVAALFSIERPKTQEANSEPPVDTRSSVVRLHDMDGNFFCSGVVVSDKNVMTAAHCVDHLPPLDVSVSVRSFDGKQKALAWVRGAHSRADFAVLGGDFKSFRKQPHSVNPKVILDKAFKSKEPLVSCGYPYAGELLCLPVVKRGTFGFWITGDSNLYPGMSGGPVMDASTGTVIAVNSAMMGGYAILAPIVEIYAALRIKP